MSPKSLPLLRPLLLLLALTGLIGAMTDETAAMKLQETMDEAERTMIVIEMAGDPGMINACIAMICILGPVGVGSDERLVLCKYSVYDHKKYWLRYYCLTYLTRHDLMFLTSQSVAFEGVADPCS